jgi:hypothetical protein
MLSSRALGLVAGAGVGGQLVRGHLDALDVLAPERSLDALRGALEELHALLRVAGPVEVAGDLDLDLSGRMGVVRQGQGKALRMRGRAHSRRRRGPCGAR